MDCNVRHVPWASTENFKAVAEALSRGDDDSLRYALESIHVWLTRLSASKIPRSILCTYHLLVAYFEKSDQSLALALMRFVSLVSSEDQDRDRPYSATPLMSLVLKAGLPGWLADLRNDIAHGSLPSTALLACGFQWAVNCITTFWDSNATHMTHNAANTDKLFKTALNGLEALLKNPGLCSAQQLLTELESALENRMVSVPVAQRSAQLLMATTLSWSKDRDARIAEFCYSIRPVFQVFREKRALHHLILSFILSFRPDGDPAKQANSVSWGLFWLQAIGHRLVGLSSDFTKYVDDKTCSMFDWRKALKHVLYDNCCPATRDLCVVLIQHIVPDLPFDRKNNIVKLLNVYLGNVTLTAGSVLSPEKLDCESGWHRSSAAWDNVPLGVDFGYVPLTSESDSFAGGNASTS